MGACKSTSLALAGWLALHAALAAADFRAVEVSARVDKQELAVSGTLELVLTSKVKEALDKGIPLVVSIGLALYRRSPVLWDRRVQGWVVQRRISYHALSRQYLVSGHRPDSQTMESFTSLQTALINMGALEVRLPLQAELHSGTDYYLRLRAHLDLEALPAPLRPVAYTSLGWHLDSGWTEWNVQR